MNNSPLIIVDADAIIAQTDTEDLHHQSVMMIAQYLTTLHARLIYPATAIAEAVTHMQRVLNNKENAYASLTTITEPFSEVAEVNKQTLEAASTFFNPKSSKKNTLFDCIIVALAKKYEADAIFSFDKFYKKQGFTLVSDLLKPILK